MITKKPYPILPTSESDTLTFLQKLDMLEYKVNQINNTMSELETEIETKSSVSATADGDVIQTITIDGETLTVPQGGGDTNIQHGTGYLSDGTSQLPLNWTLIYDKLFLAFSTGISGLTTNQSPTFVLNGLYAPLSSSSDCFVTYYKAISLSDIAVFTGKIQMVFTSGSNSGMFNFVNGKIVQNYNGTLTLEDASYDHYNDLKGTVLCFEYKHGT